MTDIKELKRSVDIVEVIGCRIEIKRNGTQFTACCPFHNERSPSFTISPTKQMFKCFGCGRSGDVIDFLVLSGLTFKQARDELENTGPALLIPDYVKSDAPRAIWNSIDPAPFFSLYRCPRIFHHKYGEPNNIYTYHKLNGEILSYTCRFDLPNGKKEVLPFTYCSNGEREEWRWRGINYPRPLYNLHLLSRPIPALISEGEKTCDALNAILGSRFNCVTWIGGSEGIMNTDWVPLKGRELLLWPDNDEPGEKAMNNIAQLFSGYSPKIKYVQNPTNADKGWDFADSNWNYLQTIDFLKTHIYVKQPT